MATYVILDGADAFVNENDNTSCAYYETIEEAIADAEKYIVTAPEKTYRIALVVAEIRATITPTTTRN